MFLTLAWSGLPLPRFASVKAPYLTPEYGLPDLYRYYIGRTGERRINESRVSIRHRFSTACGDRSEDSGTNRQAAGQRETCGDTVGPASEEPRTVEQLDIDPIYSRESQI